MKRRIPFVLLAAWFGCGGPSVPAQSAAPSNAAAITQSSAPSLPSSFDVAAIDAYIARQVPARGFVGLSVAIVKDGAIVLDKGYGQRQLGLDAPVESNTAFALASVSKQFVASIVLQLAQEKKLSVEDKVAKYFPDLTRANDITLYDLMAHVSGYHDNYPLDFLDEEMKHPVTPDEAIARYAKRPLDFEPRTRWSYSNTGYTILGRVIEKVTGRPLGVVMNERIFQPLGMTHSSYIPMEGSPGLARGYTSFAFGPPEPAQPEAHQWSFGEGGIYAPAGDVAKWDIALMGGKVLGPEAWQLLTTPRRLADGRPTTYGCGMGTILNDHNDVILRHNGEYSGFVSYNMMMPRTRSAVIVLSNRDDTAPDDLAREIMSVLEKEYYAPLLKIDGPPALEVARDLFAQMQSGRVDRSRFGEDFNVYLTEPKLRSGSARLRALGEPTQVEITRRIERGAMEKAEVRFTFSGATLEADMFRSTDGKVQQFLIYKK